MFPQIFLLCALLLIQGSFCQSINSKVLAPIVGGVPVNIEDFPYQISVQHYGSHTCGGSIASVRYIITAAHCTEGVSASAMSVRAGSSCRGGGGQVETVKRVHQHPGYTPKTMDCDISVLELASDLRFGPAVTSIGLSWADTPAGMSATVSGWGLLKEHGALPDQLQAVAVPIVSTADCRDAYHPAAITDSMLCAGYLGVGGMDSCQGDSGGPLAINGYLVGVVSWGYGCADPKYPGVYTRISDPSIQQFVRQFIGQARTPTSVSLAQRLKALLL